MVERYLALNVWSLNIVRVISSQVSVMKWGLSPGKINISLRFQKIAFWKIQHATEIYVLCNVKPRSVIRRISKHDVFYFTFLFNYKTLYAESRATKIEHAPLTLTHKLWIGRKLCKPPNRRTSQQQVFYHILTLLPMLQATFPNSEHPFNINFPTDDV